MASTKLTFLAVVVLLLQASWTAMAQPAIFNAVMTLTSFENGGPAACDGNYHSNRGALVALSTALYASGSRCQKLINIRSTQTGRTMAVRVVDGCKSDSGCKVDELSTSQAVWDALGLNTYFGEVPITWSQI